MVETERYGVGSLFFFEKIWSKMSEKGEEGKSMQMYGLCYLNGNL